MTESCKRTRPGLSPLRSAVAAAAALALLVAPSEARAQVEERPPTRAERLDDLFHSLSLDTGVRLVTGAGLVEEGRLTAVRDGSIDVVRGGVTHTVGYYDVRTVAVSGGHGLAGGIWGAAGGALVGGFFGAIYASFDCTTADACNYTEKEGAWRWATFLGAVGGSIGFLVGRTQVHFHPVFP